MTVRLTVSSSAAPKAMRSVAVASAAPSFMPLTFDRSVTRTGREVFVGMDLLRVIAALMILVYHAHSIATKNAHRQGVSIMAEPQWWYACIDLFFVMSGFLMLHMSQSLYGSPRGALVFASRRLVRTPPLYWLYTLVFTIGWTLFPRLPGATAIDATRLLKNMLFFPDGQPPIILVAWTLFLEIEFYVIFGLTLLLPRKVGPLVAIGILAGLSLVGLIPAMAQSSYAVWTDPLLLDFCLGIVIAMLFFRGATLRPAGAAIAVLVTIIALASLDKLGTRDFMRFPTYGLAAGCLVALATWRRTQLFRGRGAKLLSLFSASAYTLYLAHITFLKLTEGLFFRSFTGAAACYAYILLGCVVTLVASLVAYRVTELPLTLQLKPLALRR